MANVTIVSKGVVLPEVTVREHSDAVPTKLPVKTLQEGDKSRKLDGCDPLVSPLAGSSLSQVAGRCIAGIQAGGSRAAASVHAQPACAVICDRRASEFGLDLLPAPAPQGRVNFALRTAANGEASAISPAEAAAAMPGHRSRFRSRIPSRSGVPTSRGREPAP